METADLIVIGGGPGGYVAAIRAAQLGMKVIVAEKRDTLGGTCLNVGCIPSKALLDSSHKFQDASKHFKDHGISFSDLKVDVPTIMARKAKVVEDLTKGIEFLFKKNKITRISGHGTIKAPGIVDIGGTEYKASKILIATGSVPAVPKGFDVDETDIVSSTGALSFEQAPKHLVVMGGGYIGLEMGSVWARLGSRVTVVEFAPSIVPAMDADLGKELLSQLKKQGLEFKLGTKVLEIKKNKGLEVLVETGGTQEVIACDKVLISVGRKPMTEGLGLEALGISLDAMGRIPVGRSYETAVPGIFAIGDVIEGPMLAHKAEEEGVAAVEMMMGQHPHVNYGCIPAVIFTHPEVASVGKTEQELKAAGTPYKSGKFPFMANSKTRATGDTEGFVKVLAHPETDEVLGVHIIGQNAGVIIGEATIAMEYRASSEDIARTCHAHPTVNEALKEASLNVLGRSIHV